MPLQDFLLNKMKLGRPKIIATQKKSEIVAIRVRAEERDKLEDAAEKSGKSLSDWVRDVLFSAASRRVQR